MSERDFLERPGPFYSIAERAAALGMRIPSYGDDPLVMFEKCLAVMLAEIDARLGIGEYDLAAEREMVERNLHRIPPTDTPFLRKYKPRGDD